MGGCSTINKQIQTRLPFSHLPTHSNYAIFPIRSTHEQLDVYHHFNPRLNLSLSSSLLSHQTTSTLKPQPLPLYKSIYQAHRFLPPLLVSHTLLLSNLTQFDCLGLTTFLKNLFSNAGGGGERVLWTALSYMQRQQDKDHFLVYTGDDISKQEMLGKVKVTSFSSLLHSTFGLVLTEGARTESIRDRIGSREDRFRSIDKEVVGRRFDLSSFNPLGSEFRQYRIGDRSNLASRT